ncbi:MAG: amidohydrolase family protein [Candidatus Lokiarchaeota archaeon]|nr:amidohydrolase family protein [Candidatus Lokiarchaeota archaeon]
MIEKNNSLVKIPNPQDFKYKIHDFHCHLAEDLGQNQTRYGIRSMCIMPSWKNWRNIDVIDFSKEENNDFVNSTEYINKLSDIESSIKKWHGKIYRFIPVNFNKPKEEFNRSLDSLEITGLKLHPLQNFKINHNTLDPYFNQAEKRNLIIYIHTDWIPSTEYGKVKNLMPDTFCKIAEMYPQVTMIMGHSGFNDSYVNVWKYVKKYTNIYAETSCAPTPSELEKIVYKADPKRILFGSSYPLSHTAGEIIKITKMLKVTEPQKKAIFYDNAARLLNDRPCVEVNDK